MSTRSFSKCISNTDTLLEVTTMINEKEILWNMLSSFVLIEQYSRCFITFHQVKHLICEMRK